VVRERFGQGGGGEKYKIYVSFCPQIDQPYF